MKTVSTLAIALLLAIGTAIPAHAESLNSTSDIRDALNDAGLTCSGYETVAKDDRKWGTENAVGVAHCEVDGEDIEIDQWKDNGQKENYVGFIKKLGCTVGTSLTGKTNYNMVDGGLWSVITDSQTLAEEISDALGGEPIRIECDQD